MELINFHKKLIKMKLNVSHVIKNLKILVTITLRLAFSSVFSVGLSSSMFFITIENFVGSWLVGSVIDIISVNGIRRRIVLNVSFVATVKYWLSTWQKRMGFFFVINPFDDNESIEFLKLYIEGGFDDTFNHPLKNINGDLSVMLVK